jgi:hypothetical protein
VGFKEILGKSIAVPSSRLLYLADLMQQVQQERLDPNPNITLQLYLYKNDSHIYLD